MSDTRFFVGDLVPTFTCAASNNPRFHFETLGGRYVILSFFGSAARSPQAEVVQCITQELRAQITDEKVCFFGVTIDPEDEQNGRMRGMLPGIRYFWDYDAEVSKLYGASDLAGGLPERLAQYRAFTLLLDPSTRVLANIPMDDAATHNKKLKELLQRLPDIDRYAAVPLCAPVLIIPRVFERSFCKKLIDYYHSHDSYDSGSMTEVDGYTVGKLDHSTKRRNDCAIEDEEIQAAMRMRIHRRLLPLIEKAFQFKVTRIERYIVARYDGEHGGFFRAHRDNTTRATAHRRFACSINLNAEEFSGGELRFPEFGSRTYRAPTGGAVVFSCSLLHEATPVTKGERYATLPFFYDAEGAKIRAENLQYLKSGVIDHNRTGAES
jgi:predicted 2-oxoglutarate/Fe(II)-dependent dioxygenase YbiX/peroxiredoxin